MPEDTEAIKSRYPRKRAPKASFITLKSIPFLLAMAIGFAVSLRLSEEQRNRFLRALREAREMMFRVFV